MGSTARGLPYPEGSEQPQVHLDIKALADAVDTELTGVSKSVGLFGRGNAKSGGTPPSAATGRFLIQSGNAQVAFTAGSGTLNFPAMFPNGLLSLVVTLSNSAQVGGSAASRFLTHQSGTASGANVIVRDNAGGVPSNETLDFSYIAIGW